VNHRVVDAVGIAKRHVIDPGAAQPLARDERRGARCEHQDRQQQWQIHAVP